MKIKDILKTAKENWSNPDLLAIEVLLAFVSKKSKEYIFMNKEFDLDDQIVSDFFSKLDLLITGKPIAQIVGKKEFYGMEFLVNEHVLIPRPESELVVDLAVNFLRESNLSNAKVLDVGTGSGCILIAIKSAINEIFATGVDISDKALEIARLNSKLFKIDCDFYQSDLLDKVDQVQDVIVTNLPYIGRKRFNFVASDVAEFEPEIALFGGDDGLDLYRKLFFQLNQKKWSFRLLIGEFGFGQSDLMQSLLEQSFPDYQNEIIPDLAGIPRVFMVKSRQ